MATNYFEGLGFGRAMNRPYEVAQSMSNLQTQALNRDLAKQQGVMQQQAQQANTSAFNDAKIKQRTAEASGLIYSALSSGQPERAAQLAMQFENEFKALDPTFSAQGFAQMAATPEGMKQLQQETLTLSQIMAGPEQAARFMAQQASPAKTPEATAQIKNTAEYRRYTQAIRDALKNGDKALAKDLSDERDFFVKQTDPFQRSLASGQGAGQAKVVTEQELNPVMAERAGLQEAAKLSEQQTIKEQEKASKNQTAYASYEQAANSVKSLSDKAGSGLFGLAPAVFADDRLFEGAISILRPAIKDVVRGSGEGTFTDSDQRVMDQMLPSRVDSPEVRMTKLQMLDNFIRAKLGQQPAEQQAQQPQQPAQQPVQIGRFTVEVE